LGALEPLKYSSIIAHLQDYADKKQTEKLSEEHLMKNKHLPTDSPKPFRKERSESQLESLTVLLGNRKAKSGSELEEDLIRSEVLLDDDNSESVHLVMYGQCVMRSIPSPFIEEPKRRTPHQEDYYPRVVISSLMKMLHEKSLAVHYPAVAQSIMV